MDFRRTMKRRVTNILKAGVAALSLLAAVWAVSAFGHDYLSLRGLSFSPDGKRIVFLSGVYDFRITDDLGKTSRNFISEERTPGCIAFLKTGTIATGHHDGSIIVYNSNGVIEKTLKDPMAGDVDAILQLLPSMEGRFLASVYSRSVCLWNERFNPVYTFRSNGGHLSDAALSPDGRIIAVAYDKGGLSIHRPENVRLLGIVKGIRFSRVLFSRSGEWVIAAAGEGTIHLRGLDGSLQGKFKTGNGDIHDLTVSPENRIAAAIGDKVKIFTFKGKALRTLAVKEDSDSVTSVSYSPDGGLIAAGTYGGKLYVWRTDGTLLSSSGAGKPRSARDSGVIAGERGALKINVLQDGKRPLILRNVPRDPDRVLRGLICGPHRVNGKIVGYKLKRVKPYNILYGVGSRADDIILKINGQEMISTEAFLQFWNMKREAERFSVEMLRKQVRETRTFVVEREKNR